MTTTCTYDKAIRLLSIAQTAAGQTVSSHAYTYSSADLRIRADLADGSYWLYTYDALGQVTGGTRYWSDGTVVAGQSFGYAFDDIGNRQTGGRTDSPSTHTANALNQYTQRIVPGRAEILGEVDGAAIVTVTKATGRLSVPESGLTTHRPWGGVIVRDGCDHRRYRGKKPVPHPSNARPQSLQPTGGAVQRRSRWRTWMPMPSLRYCSGDTQGDWREEAVWLSRNRLTICSFPLGNPLLPRPSLRPDRKCPTGLACDSLCFGRTHLSRPMPRARFLL